MKLSKKTILALTCITLWGANFALTKFVLKDFTPLFSIAIRLFFLGVIFAPFFPVPKKEILKLIIFSFCSFTITLGLTALSVEKLDASLVAFMIELEVPFAVLLSFIFFKEKICWKKAIGMLISLFGIYLISESPEVDPNNIRYLFYSSVAAFFYAISVVQVKSIKLEATTLTIWAAIFASPQCLLLSSFFEKNQFSQMRQAEFSTYIVLAITAVTSFFAFFVWNDLLKKNKIQEIVPFSMLIPVSSLFFSYFILGEVTHLLAIFGGGLTLLGVWFQIMEHDKKKSVKKSNVKKFNELSK